LNTYEKAKQPDKKADSSGCSSFTVSELMKPQQSTPEYGRYAYNFCDLPINDPTAVASERKALIGRLGTSGGGEALDSKTRARMETDFGYNFGSVRVHTDNYAVNLTGALNAKATCYGQDIYFGKNHFAPNTQKGTDLLRHELGHFQQQNQLGTKIIQNQEEAKDSQKSSNHASYVYPPPGGHMTFIYIKPTYNHISATPMEVSREEGGMMRVKLTVSQLYHYVDRGLDEGNYVMGAFIGDGILIPETLMVRVIMPDDGKDIEVPASALFHLKDEYDTAFWWKLAETIGYGVTIASLGSTYLAATATTKVQKLSILFSTAEFVNNLLLGRFLWQSETAI